MISRIDLRGKGASAVGDAAARRAYADVLPRAALDVEAALDAVRPICDDVRARGAAAVRDATAALRRRRPRRPPGCPPRRSTDALDALDPAVRAALEEAVRRARLVHEAQRRTDATVEVVARRRRHRALGAGPPGRPLRPGRPRRLSRPASS